MIDPTFLRPGRFEHIVEIGPLVRQQYVEFMRRISIEWQLQP